MRKQLSPQQIELYTRIDEILFYKWDPIGISDGNWARDEYQSYLPKIFSLASEHDNPKAIAEYLTEVTTESMGLSPAKEHDLRIAMLIIEIKDSIDI